MHLGSTREPAPQARLMRLARQVEARVPCEQAEVQSPVLSTRTGAGQLLLVGRLPHVSCTSSLLTSGRPESWLHKRGSCGLRVGLRPGCHANKPRCNRPSYPLWHKDGRRQLLLVGRLRVPHVSCSLLTSGRPESWLHKRGSCGLRVGLRPGCHADKPGCNRPSYPQGWTPAAPSAAGTSRSTPSRTPCVIAVGQVSQFYYSAEV